MGIVVHEKLYLFGGYTDLTSVPKTRSAIVYDPLTQRWAGLPPLPRPMTHSGIATDGDNIYLAGGVVGGVSTGEPEKINAIAEVWRYNIASKQWAAMPPLPEPRGAGGLALLGRYLHYFGGTADNRHLSVADHWRLDLDGGTGWERMPDLPQARNHLSQAVVDDKLYVIGGQEGHNSTLVAFTAVHEWDPARGTWRERAPLPERRSHASAATLVIAGRIYLFGGEVEHTISVAPIFAYDPRTDSWTSAGALPIPRHSGVAGLLGDTIIYTTGNLLTQTFVGSFVLP